LTSPRFLHRERIQDLIGRLRELGYRCIGPRVRDGAIVYDALRDASDLPIGIGIHQAPGRYWLEHQAHGRCFAWCPTGIDITAEAAAICTDTTGRGSQPETERGT
jgi:sulfhydrogenase subunit beta (sulfur reductase)